MMRKKIVIIILGCLLLLPSVVSAQNVKIGFTDSTINFIASNTVNITVDVISDTDATIYLDFEVLPNDIGFNITYPESIDLIANQQQTFIIIWKNFKI